MSKLIYKIEDNFLSKQDFLNIKNNFLNIDFPWHLTGSVADGDSNDGYYFTHLIYCDYSPRTKWYDLLIPIFCKIQPLAIHRVKANFYPTTNEVFKHKQHVDLHESHKGCIFYLNTNNGKTILNDGTEIDSVENRMLFFDPSIPHRSTTCTDQKFGRFNINFNYF